jgi:hypothetical protein
LLLLFFLWVANPISSFGSLSNSSIVDCVITSVVGCEHPPLYMSGSGRASLETAISGSCQHRLVYLNTWWCCLGRL